MGAKSNGSVWPVVPLGQIARKVTRKNTGGLTRVLTASGKQGLVDQREYFSRSVAGADLSSYYHLRRGEFAYNRSEMDGYPYGAIKRLERYSDGIVSILYICFSLFDPDCDQDFYTHLFESGLLNPQFRSIAKVGGRAHGLLNVSDSDFYAIQVPKPPIELQRRVTRTLNAVDEAIEATRAVIEQTRRLKSALLQELLTKGLPGRHRSYRSIYRIGRIPADWSDARLGEVAEVVQGIAIDPSRTPKVQPTPYLRVANVQQGSLDLSEIKKIETSETERKNLGLKVNDVLMVEGHANIEELGRAALVPKAAEGMVFQNHLFRVRPDRNRLDPRFLTIWINSPSGRRYFKIFGGTTSGLNTVGSGQIRALRLPLPEIKEQHSICNVLESLDDRVLSAEDDLNQLTTVKSALSQGLLTGRIRVKGGR